MDGSPSQLTQISGVLLYLDYIIYNGRKKTKGIPLPTYQQLLTLCFADDQVVVSKTEDNLQKAAYKLNQMITEHG